MRLLTAELDSEFATILSDERVQRVDIATAWATVGPALESLEEVGKQRHVRVRALVGVAGGHTNPCALERLRELGQVRLVDGGSGLFHVKLYLFRGRRTSIAWIGSANFTCPGFEKNEEILLETTATADVADWFERRWKGIDATQSRKRLREYCKTWKPPATPSPDDVDESDRSTSDARCTNKQESASDDVDNDRIAFVQEGKRPTPLVGGGHMGEPPQGIVRIAGKSYRYESAQEAQKLVFDELQRRDESFLTRCNNDDRFHRKTTHFIARRKRGLGSKRFRKYPQKIGNGWWMAVQTTTPEKWKLILWAAENAGLRVDVEGEYWSRKAKDMKVGF